MSNVAFIAKVTEGITKKWLMDHGFPTRTWVSNGTTSNAAAKHGCGYNRAKGGLKRPINHRWMEDYTHADIKKLPPEALDYLRIFVLESVYNTFSTNPKYQIHKDFVKDGKVVGAKRMEGYGIYRDYNIAEKDLLTNLMYPNPEKYVGMLVNVDAEASSMNDAFNGGDEGFDPNDLYPAVEGHEDSVIDLVDTQRWAKQTGVELDTEHAGTSPKRMVATIVRPDGTKLKVEGMTYLNVRGILVRDVKAVDGSRLWPDDRQLAAQALHEKRRSNQDKIVQKRSLKSDD